MSPQTSSLPVHTPAGKKQGLNTHTKSKLTYAWWGVPQLHTLNLKPCYMLMKVISLQDMHETGTRECSYLICCYTSLQTRKGGKQFRWSSELCRSFVGRVTATHVVFVGVASLLHLLNTHLAKCFPHPPHRAAACKHRARGTTQTCANQ